MPLPEDVGQRAVNRLVAEREKEKKDIEKARKAERQWKRDWGEDIDTDDNEDDGDDEDDVEEEGVSGVMSTDWDDMARDDKDEATVGGSSS
jgi:hypothetical protein